MFQCSCVGSGLLTRVGHVCNQSFSSSKFFLVFFSHSKAAECDIDADVFVLCFRSRQLELEDKQSTLELELRKFMEMTGVYCCDRLHLKPF